ncbi:hypothetical protein [Hydrotalea sp.]|uniref:hypothetical protein n=1 Tax=Hydrotalea sp. TaxID=2881279 RepID=UPI002631F04B|nr:hypothetical protein [Hydrotalea sp.]
MKQKLLLLISFVFVYVASWSQLAAGDKLIGPSFNLYTSKTETIPVPNYTNNSILGLGIGMNLIKMRTATDGFGVGIKYNYNEAKFTGITPGDYAKQHSNAFYLNLYKRKYIPLHAKWSLFYDVGLSGGLNVNNYSQAGAYVNYYQYGKIQGYTIGAFAYPGIAYFIKKNFLADISLSNFLTATFSHQQTDYISGPNPGGVDKTDAFSFNSTVIGNNFINNMTINFRWILK